MVRGPHTVSWIFLLSVLKPLQNEISLQTTFVNSLAAKNYYACNKTIVQISKNIFKKNVILETAKFKYRDFLNRALKQLKYKNIEKCFHSNLAPKHFYIWTCYIFYACQNRSTFFKKVRSDEHFIAWSIMVLRKFKNNMKEIFNSSNFD